VTALHRRPATALQLQRPQYPRAVRVPAIRQCQMLQAWGPASSTSSLPPVEW
jgi:hypothetical protein